MEIGRTDAGRMASAKRLVGHKRSAGFTLVEVMVVIAIVGLLTSIALPAFRAYREDGESALCINNQRLIYHAIKAYCTIHDVGLTSHDWPNLCAARDRLSPGGQERYLKNWDVFECPVADSQSQHDYAYVFENGEIAGVRCNNAALSIRNRHNR
jgi:prepilin-type N-terminal cleavage/methylation domain-containing protein